MTAVKAEAYIDLEVSQVEQGVSAIDKVASSWAAKFGLALQNDDLDKAAQLTNELDLSGATKTLRKPSLILADSLVAYGATQVVDGDLAAITVSPLTDPLVLNTQVFIVAAVKTAQTAAFTVAQQMVADASMGLAMKAEADVIKPLKAAMRSLSINMSLVSSRLASYGYLLQARENGELLYMLSAVLDDRTSDFCMAIDGKIIPVQVGFDRAVQVLSATTPEEAAAVAPWPVMTEDTAADIQKAGYEELIRMGFVLPPFHPFCRTILQFVSAKTLNRVITSTTQTTSSSTPVITGSTPASTLSLLGVGAAVAASLAGEDDTSLILPGVPVDVVQAAVEAIASGASNLEIINELGLTWSEVSRLRDL